LGPPFGFGIILLQLHKTLSHEMNPFDLALGFEMKKPMDIPIFRIRNTCCEGNKEAKVMAKKMKIGKHMPTSS
jgi:hypothetical protein